MSSEPDQSRRYRPTNTITAGLVAILLLAVVAAPTLGQDLPPLQPPQKGHPRLPSVLQELFDAFKASPAQGRAFAQRHLLPQHVEGDSVRLILWPQGMKASNIATGALKAVGATVEGESASLVRARVPIPKLIALANQATQASGVKFIELPTPPDPLEQDAMVGAQGISEGVELTGATEYHDNGIDGSGVKVSIIDLGFSNIQQAINDGEFGSPHVIDSNCTKNYQTGDSGISAVDTGGDHGVHVAHIVHNMAPGATLCLKLIGDLVDLENAIDDSVSQGVTVANHSVGWANVDSYYDGTGSVDSLVTNAFDNGILWANSAGNYADGPHWQGSFSDGDGDSVHNFSGSDECNLLSLESGQILRLLMNWDDYPSSSQDYDLFLYRSGVSSPVASSTSAQDGSQQPEEAIYYSAPATDTYCWLIENFSGPATAEIEVFTFTSTDFEHFTESSSLTDPANGLDTVAVAAIRDSNWTTGPQEPFSSQGPTNDSKHASSRTAPAISGPDGTTSYDGSDFFGTSGSSPHVAGCAALIRDANPGFSPSEVRSQLESEAIDMGTSGQDNIYGWGRMSCTYNPPAVFRVENDGDVFASRAYHCGLQSGCFNAGQGADIAERIDTSDPVEPGDLIAIDPTREVTYRKSREAYSELVVGVVSTAPAITLGNVSAELQGLLNRVVLQPYRTALVGRLAVRESGAATCRPVEAGPVPALTKTVESRTPMVGPQRQGTHEGCPYHGHGSLGAYGLGAVGAWRDFAGAQHAVLLQVQVGANVQWGPTVAVLVDHERTERLWNRLPGRPLMALMGRVLVKATAENGPIRPGDLLVSAARPGHAMRCADPDACEGAIIGKALEWLASGTGTIEMLLMR